MFSGPIQISSSELNTTSSYKVNRLGTEGCTPDGRKYRYIQNGAVSLAPGKTVNAIAKVANHTTQTVNTAAAVGSYTVSVTVGATAMTQDQYLDGYLVAKDAAGLGTAYAIAGNTSISSAGGSVTVQLREPLVTAMTTSSIISFVNNPWAGVVVAPAAAAEVVVGVPQLTIPASVYGWVQTVGIASVLSDGIISKGAGAIQSASVIGAMVIEGTSAITQNLAWAPEATVDTKYDPLYLMLA